MKTKGLNAKDGWRGASAAAAVLVALGLAAAGGGVMLLACVLAWLTGSGLPAAAGLAAGSLLVGTGGAGLFGFLCWKSRTAAPGEAEGEAEA